MTQTAISPKKRVGKTRGDRIFDAILYTLAALMVLVALYPMYFIVIASISDPNLVAQGEILFVPRRVTLEGYRYLLGMGNLWTGYGNTVLYTAVGTLIMLAVNLPVAYALSRKDLVGRKLFTLLSDSLYSFIYASFFAVILY